MEFMPLINTIQSARPLSFTSRKSSAVRGLAIANITASPEKTQRAVQFSSFRERSKLVAMRRPIWWCIVPLVI
jgi:hypothetical protein